MAPIEKILFPVDFSRSCVAMAAYVKSVASLFNATVTLMHVVDLASHNGFELYLRPTPEISEEHRAIGRKKLDSFLTRAFPPSRCPRILASGDTAAQISQVAGKGKFELIVMPTHAGVFRHMLLGSTTAKVLNDTDCPVLTSRHAERVSSRSPRRRQWLCAIGLSPDSVRVLQFASRLATEAHAKLSIIHAVQPAGPALPITLGLEGQFQTIEERESYRRLNDLQLVVGSKAPIRIAVGAVKAALLEAVLGLNADVLIIGRSPQPGTLGRMRDLTYAMIRDSPVPVLSV